MTWTGSADARPSARIAALAPSLQRTERLVVETIGRDRARAVELTAQQLADWAGVGRTSVIRAAQSLGYEGYPQLRVALVQELATESTPSPNFEGANIDTSALGTLRQRVSYVGSRLSDTVSALTPELVDSFLTMLNRPGRLLVLANGLSSPLGLALVMRLSTLGRAVEHHVDPIAQQITARQLGTTGTCLVVSGSGANRATLEAMDAATAGGAQVVAITSFANSPITDVADLALVFPPINDSFQDELIHTSRAALMLIVEELVELYAEHLDDRGQSARALALSALATSIKD